MQTQPPPATPTTENEKLFLQDRAKPVTSQVDPNGALWSLANLARKFEELHESGALAMAPPGVKDVCDPKLPLTMIAQALGLECSLDPDMLGGIFKLWESNASSRLKKPMAVHEFIFVAHNHVQMRIAGRLNASKLN